MTIYDIAKLAGVNPSTVSRALNQPGRVSASMEERIRKAADELDFHANPLARALPTGRMSTIALVLADITNPVVFDIIRGAEHAAREAGYTLILAESQESSGTEAATIDRVTPAVDGIVLASSRLPDASIAGIARRKPVVAINREGLGLTNVAPDIRPGVSALVEHLEELGHRTITFVSGPQASWASNQRWEVILAEARDRGLSVFEIGPTAPTVDGGAAAFDRVRASGATAVIAYNDMVAIGLLRSAEEAGISVPGDLSIAGFDDVFGTIFGDARFGPGLTSVRADLYEAARRAVLLLLNEIGVDAGAAPSTPLTTALTIRTSTGPPTRG